MRHFKKGATVASSSSRVLNSNAALLRTTSKPFRSSTQQCKPEAANSVYMDQMYTQWKADPTSVDPSW